MMLRSLWCSSLHGPNILVTECALKIQKRTTFVLKRRWQAPLSKNRLPSEKLRAKNFIYELIEDSTVKEKKKLEVVLTQYVEGIGEKGDVISMKPKFSYSKLLLPGYGVYKTAGNEINKSRMTDENVLHSSPYTQRTVNMLKRITLAVIMNKDVPWTLEPWHIRSSLRKAGFQSVESCITLPKTPITGPDLSKQNKEFCVTIKINDLEEVSLKCRIHHWSSDPSERLPYIFEHWKLPAEPLLIQNQ